MPIFPVSPDKQRQLEEEMERLGIVESDLLEAFIKGSGAGGQKINKTSIAVLVRHVPSGIAVRCQASRSQALNRFLARRLLIEKFKERIYGEQSAERQRREKIRRQKRRRSRRAKEKMLADKSHQSQKKDRRRLPEY